MQVFDFDNTLYYGESAVDFAVWMIRHNRRILLWLPRIFWNLLKYKLCLVDRESIEQPVNEFLRLLIRDEAELRRTVARFWETHRRFLNQRVIAKIRPGDVIITAGPSFLLEPIHAELKGVRMICSEVDLQRRRVVYINMHDNKARRFREEFGQAPIARFYTDSFNDRAMMEIAERVYLVKRSRIKRIK